MFYSIQEIETEGPKARIYTANITNSSLRCKTKQDLRLLRTFASVLPCPPEKNSYARHLKRNHSKLYIIGKLNNNIDFGRKKMNSHLFNSTKENCKKNLENDHVSFNETNELIGYQNSAGFCEIWPEHSLDVVKQKCVGDF